MKLFLFGVLSWLLLSLMVCSCEEITVKGVVGQNITLSCHYDWKYHGKCQICWMRGDIPYSGCGDEIISTDGDKVITKTSDRYQLSGELQQGNVSLTIINAKLEDTGKYGCRVQVPGWFNDKKIVTNLLINEDTNPASVTEMTSHTSKIQTEDPSDTEPTEAINNSSTVTYFKTTEPDFKKSIKETMDDAVPITVISLMVILLALATATIYMVWKKKKQGSRIRSGILQEGAVIYSNSEITLGFNRRSEAAENVYQLDIENVYEQWSP